MLKGVVHFLVTDVLIDLIRRDYAINIILNKSKKINTRLALISYYYQVALIPQLRYYSSKLARISAQLQEIMSLLFLLPLHAEIYK